MRDVNKAPESSEQRPWPTLWITVHGIKLLWLHLLLRRLWIVNGIAFFVVTTCSSFENRFYQDGNTTCACSRTKPLIKWKCNCVIVWNIVWVHSKPSLSDFAWGLFRISSKFWLNFTRNFVSIDGSAASDFKLALHVGSLATFLVVYHEWIVYTVTLLCSFHDMSRLDCAISLSICELSLAATEYLIEKILDAGNSHGCQIDGRRSQSKSNFHSESNNKR